MESVLVTGANAGLGKEACRLIALRDESKLVILGCRSMEKAEAAMAELEQSTGKKIFKIAIMDTTSIPSIRAAVSKLDAPLDGIILNAGGLLGNVAANMTPEGVRVLFAANVLGHAALVNALIEQGKLKKAVVFSSSEAARGIPSLGFDRPKLASSSVEEFIDVAKGEATKFDPAKAYGPVKYTGTLWMSAMARKHPNIKFVSVSPGMTTQTNAAEDLPALMKFMFKRVLMPLFKKLGRAHGVNFGATRYVDALYNSKYESGKFYASPWPKVTGPLVDQTPVFEDIGNHIIQDNAHRAVESFL